MLEVPTHMAMGRPTVPYGPADGPAAPDVVGMALLDARRLAGQHGLRLVVSVWETKIGPWGLILSQHPAAGSTIRRGERVHVVVAGRPHLVVPDVAGLESGVAMERLRRAGLQPVHGAQRSSRSIPDGHVVATRPRAGTLVVDGSSIVVETSKRASIVRPRDAVASDVLEGGA